MSNTLGLSFPFDSGAVSQVMGWPFGDFVVVGDQTFGLAPGGVYAIGGPDDAATPIAVAVDGPRHDADSDAFKRVREVVVQGRGEMAVSVRSEQHDWKTAANTGGGRFVVGRDNAGREFQFRIEGSGPVEITGVTLRLENLGRRQRR